MRRLLTGLAAVAIVAAVLPLLLTASASADASFPIENAASGKCLDVYHSGTSSGTNVDMYTCNGTAAQQWVLNDLGSGWFEIENPNSLMCLDDSNSGTSNYNNVQIYYCNGSNAQKWWIGYNTYAVPIISGVPHAPSMCLDDYHSGTADYNNVDIYACNGSNAQKWDIGEIA